MVFAIKMLLDNTYGLLNLLEFNCNNIFQAESEFKNSNFGGKSSELLIQCRFPNKFDFSNKFLNRIQIWGSNMVSKKTKEELYILRLFLTHGVALMCPHKI